MNVDQQVKTRCCTLLHLSPQKKQSIDVRTKTTKMLLKYEKQGYKNELSISQQRHINLPMKLKCPDYSYPAN